MARQRRLTGKPLLLATAGVALAVGCGGVGKKGGEVMGNLMPPPKTRGHLCVEVTPPDALVEIDGHLESKRCSFVEAYDGQFILRVTAKGYADWQEGVELKPEQTLKIDLVPLPIRDVAPKPVGNLMPPAPVPSRDPAESGKK